MSSAKCRKCSAPVDISKVFDRKLEGGFKWTIYEPGSFVEHQCVESKQHREKRLIRESDRRAMREDRIPYKD